MKLQLAFLAATAAICQADLSLLKPVLTKMAERFNTRVTAVNSLYDAALTADTTNFFKWPHCCDKEVLTETFDSSYGCLVDSTLACVRGYCGNTNRTADMPSTLEGELTCANSVLGQEFYDACEKNTKTYGGTSWQFWQSETGVFLMYPGSHSGTCDREQPSGYREQPWYIRAKDALITSSKNSVQFSSKLRNSSPHFGFQERSRNRMVTASRSVSSLEDHIFQGVVGMDTNITYLVEPLADVDAAEDSYSFMIDGNNGEIMAHPKLKDVTNYIKTGKHPVKYADVEPNKEIQDAIAAILGHATGEFTLDLVRYKTYRSDFFDSEDNIVECGAYGFWFTSHLKENIQISCANLEISGAAIKYTICAVKYSDTMQLHCVMQIVFVLAIATSILVKNDKVNRENMYCYICVCAFIILLSWLIIINSNNIPWQISVFFSSWVIFILYCGYQSQKGGEGV